jgi:hypothetical protein
MGKREGEGGCLLEHIELCEIFLNDPIIHLLPSKNGISVKN